MKVDKDLACGHNFELEIPDDAFNRVSIPPRSDLNSATTER